jgi:tricarballylate dehydrogenase
MPTVSERDGAFYDVIVVGSGNAGFCAALSARELGARVLLLEKGSEDWIGGNSYFTAGAFRTTFAGLDDLLPLLDRPDPVRLALTDVEPYTTADFTADMHRVTEGRCDRTLTDVLVHEAAGTLAWLRRKGMRFELLYDRQSFNVDGRWRFWGGLVVGTRGGGKGLIAQHRSLAAAAGIEVRCQTPMNGLLGDAVRGIGGVHTPEGELRAGAVVLTCGGFEASPGLRAAHLGPGWGLAKVRGTPHNTGEGLIAALDAGGGASGQWSGCHSVAWDAGAPPHGDRELTHLFTKQCYPFGLVVNARGERFVDEGADFRNYTYAKYGAAILSQPGSVAYQLFDSRTAPLLRQDEYAAPGVSRHEAATLDELAIKVGIDRGALRHTVSEFNAAVQPGSFNPAIKDGKHTTGIAPPKSNWALVLDRPPFLAFAVTCGITFTFGGLRIDGRGRVLDGDDRIIPGLYGAGELVGGLFHFNYPGGSGLTSGAVLGRRAGASAAASALGRWDDPSGELIS